MEKPEEYFNNSSWVTSDLLDMDGNTVGANTENLFKIMEEYRQSEEGEGTINFLYFAWNHSGKDLADLFASFDNPSHFEDSFIRENRLDKHSSTTQSFLAWFMGLSQNYKTHVLLWVKTNYRS